MSTAGVHSIAALGDFKASLATYETEGKESLSVIDMTVRRSLEWFEHDLLKFWQTEVRKREDLLNNAKADLERCRMQKFGDKTPDCTDQKVAVKKAQARLEEAETKLKAVKKWCPVLEEEVRDYRSQAQGLQDLLAGDFPKARADLNRMLTALEAYVGMRAPTGENVMTRPIDDVAPAEGGDGTDEAGDPTATS